MASINSSRSGKRTFWVVTAFYLLIAMEFLYMATPFAMYFYSVYGPGLHFLNGIPGMAWASTFFLPHIVPETSSVFINSHNVIGALFAIIGFLMFCATAAQVYFNKLTSRGAVTDGLYRYIRHPQYASLIMSGLGMLLLWPRYLALILYITMLFAYYFLARVEEKECTDRFGASYAAYKTRVGMFLPWRVIIPVLPMPNNFIGRVLTTGILYAGALAGGIVLANGIKTAAVQSLYTYSLPSAVFLSASQIETAKLEAIALLAQSDRDVQTRIGGIGKDALFINYVTPVSWHIAEIPMAGGGSHMMPHNYDRNLYKVIFTQALLPAGQMASGVEILSTAIHKMAVVEVWIDLANAQVTRVLNPPAVVNYEGLPVPIY